MSLLEELDQPDHLQHSRDSSQAPDVDNVTFGDFVSAATPEQDDWLEPAEPSPLQPNNQEEPQVPHYLSHQSITRTESISSISSLKRSFASLFSAMQDQDVSTRPRIPPKGAPSFRNDEGWNKNWDFDAQDSIGGSIQLRGLKAGVRTVMDEDLADAIRPNLPGRSRLERDWTIVYSSEQHGISLHTLYNRVKSETRNDGQGNGLVLAVRDTSEHVFGAFVNEGFKLSRDYYGNGECFLWKAVPFDSKDFRVGSSVKCFRWTGRNDYMILSDSTMLSIGGGDGKFGLWVDSNFDKGFTATCPCFNNEVLCAVGSEAPSQSSFDILQLELWNIG